MEDIKILIDIYTKNSNKLQKLCLAGNVSLALNVFTLGPMAQATLISCEGTWDGWDDYKACFYFGQGSQIGFYFGRVPHVQKILVMGKSK